MDDLKNPYPPLCEFTEKFTSAALNENAFLCLKFMLPKVFFNFHHSSKNFISYFTKFKYFKQKFNTTFNNGSLGSRIDEERSEMRYVM